MTPGEMEREIAGCIVRAMADGSSRDGIQALVAEMMPAVLHANIELPNGDTANGFTLTCDHGHRFVEVKLGCE